MIFPLQIRTLIYRGNLFSGQFNTFGSVFVYVGEIFLLLAIAFYALDVVRGGGFVKALPSIDNLERVLGSVLMLLLMWVVFGVFWSTDRMMVLLQGFRLLELFGFIFLLGRGVLSRDEVLRFLFLGAALQVLIGLGQYFSQSDLGLQFLGESHLSSGDLNVAKVNLGGERIIRAYGTFGHANIFGGFLVVCLCLVVQKLRGENWHKMWYWLIAFMVGILLSFSRGAWLAMLAFSLAMIAMRAVKIHWKPLVIGLVGALFVVVWLGVDRVIINRIFDFSANALDERLLFSEVAVNMIRDNLWYGVGAGNFVVMMPKYSVFVLAPWLFQPVHNVFMLLLAEIGVPGVLLVLGVGIILMKMLVDSMWRIIRSDRYYWKNYWALMLALLVLAMLDHYLYTSWSGQVMMALIAGLIWYDYRQRLIALNS